MHGFDDDDEDPSGDDGSPESLVWQLLALINPGDADLARQQFAAWQDALDDGDDAPTAVQRIARVIDWQSGFQVGADDTRALVQAIDELATRWNLALDWNGDPDDDEFHADQDVPSLLAVAFDGLAEHGYTLWSWETDDGSYAGWMTRSNERETMRELATMLEINLCLASEVS